MSRSTSMLLLTLCLVTALPTALPAGEKGRGGAGPPPETHRPRYRENYLGMKFVLIPAGSFTMGSPPTEVDRDRDEGPMRKVTISRPFWLSVTEVTQGQWKEVVGSVGSFFKGKERPVERVSFYECKGFIKRLNALDDKANYRLPTEAEWEYACRAGGTGAYCFGNEVEKLGEYAWFADNSDGRSHRVGTRKPNGWGLYDMHGNLWEWCSDWYDEEYYSKGPSTDPKGPARGTYRVLRGGSWHSRSLYNRSAYRHNAHPRDQDNNFGFRLVME